MPFVNVCTLDTAERLLLDSVERSLLTDEMLGDEPAWPMEQVVAELSQAAQQQSAELKWQHLTGEKAFLPDKVECALTEDCTMTEAPTLESNDSVDAAGFLQQRSSADTSQAPLVFINCNDGVPGCMCSQPGPGLGDCALGSSPSTGGAHVSPVEVSCALEGCPNPGFHDLLTDTHERCCTLAHERILAAHVLMACTKSASSTGEAQSISVAFQSGPETETYVHMPVGMTGELVRAEQHPLAGFSCGGAHDMGSSSIEPREPIGDLTTTCTDDELSTCVGICDTGQCADGCKCSWKLKRKRPLVHAPAADLAEGTFKRPALFRKGDAVEFVAPERRIRLRTFGTIQSVQHVGAQPYYTAVSAKGTIYSFSEDCLRSRVRPMQNLRCKVRSW